MKVVMSSGHGLKIRGARGDPVPPQLDEVDQARRVVDRTAELLRAAGVECVVYHDDVSTTQSANLDWIVDHHNNTDAHHDYDISVHFNAYDHSAHGTEVLYVSQEGLAAELSEAISIAGNFTNRGAKYRSDLKFLNSTRESAVLLEVCFCDHTSDSQNFTRLFEPICTSIASTLAGKEIDVGPTPQPPEPEPVPPEGEHPTIGKGDKGSAVVELQQKLGVLEADGDFGSITDTWVRAFQGACGLSKDGIVGPMTWAEVDDLTERVETGTLPLPRKLADRIIKLAEASEIQEYEWPDRGMTPPGYIPGMALCFAYAVREWQDGSAAAGVMAEAQNDPDTDALAWYDDEFEDLDMDNDTDGLDTLRHLFVMMIGLGPRESSARYVEGRDLSADNVESDTCEAGLFQTSWNIRNADSSIEPLLEQFWDNPNGFLETFKQNVMATADNLNSYGSGDGIRYQWLSRFCPLFHVFVTGVGLRTLRAHWGPVGRREVTLRPEADELLIEVQKLVESVA